MNKCFFLTLSIFAALASNSAQAQFVQFEFRFDENGKGAVSFDHGANWAASNGFAQIDPTYGVNALTYQLPTQIGAGTADVLDPSGALSDAFHFYNQNATGYMSYYSGDHTGQLADTLSGGFVPVSGFSIVENANGSFEYFSGGAQFVNNDYFGQSSSVPEPSSLALLGLGGIGLAIGAYRRRRTAAAG